ncbi:hypothetical protein BFW01_g7434 [Lasiodiplodia theobromae]|nr:hypothetical protein BFW01_g7434 [Lasiodiplodia theobromae]
MASNNDYDPALEPGTPWHHHPLAIKIGVGIPAILFVLASLVVLAQALKHRTWCAWALVLAGLYLAFGTYNLNMGYTFDHLMGLGPSLADDKSAMRMMGFIDLGGILVMQATLITFSRLVSFLQPSDSALLGKVVVAHVLVSIVNILVALTLFKPALVKFSPFLELPLYAAVIYLQHAYKQHVAQWAEQKNAMRLPKAAASRPWMNLFYATRRIAVILAIRAVVGAFCTITGQFNKDIYFNLLTNQMGLLLCFWTYCRNFPGWFLPREYTVLIYRGQANDYKSVPLEDMS